MDAMTRTALCARAAANAAHAAVLLAAAREISLTFDSSGEEYRLAALGTAVDAAQAACDAAYDAANRLAEAACVLSLDDSAVYYVAYSDASLAANEAYQAAFEARANARASVATAAASASRRAQDAADRCARIVASVCVDRE